MNKTEFAQLLSEMETNVLRMLEYVTEEDLNSRNWYHDCLQECQTASTELSVNLTVFVEMVAALSPFQLWDNNIQSAIDIVKTGKTCYGMPINRMKAVQILGGDNSKFRGGKVTSFAKNILDPNRIDIVTIDQWMLRIFRNMYAKLNAPTEAQYPAIMTEFIRIAESLSWHPSELQAVLWVCVRRHVKETNKTFKVDNIFS